MQIDHLIRNSAFLIILFTGAILKVSPIEVTL